MDSIRLAHISDIHISTRPCSWHVNDWLSKRLTSWFNLRFLGRGARFHQADQVLTALVEELHERRPDRVVFSGDATALGFEEEIARAAQLLGLHNSQALPGIAVPGNHDYCTRRAESSGAFERHFAPWLDGQRLDGAAYPFAQRVGPAWLVGLNSATGNRWVWDASGRVGEEQLGRLARLLDQLEPGPRILVTHYPVCRAGGEPEAFSHRLHDVQAVADVARQHGVALWLHGHLHRAFRHPTTSLTPFPVICAGSSTQSHLWSYGDYTLTGRQLHGVRRVFDLESGRFRDAESFDLELPG
jgi:3',5'-cyclic AMP phosphodiesterase CpdA